MDGIKLSRLKELHSFFRGDWRATSFKGSKAQKKNALKEYTKLLDEYNSEKRAQREQKIAALQHKIQSLTWSLENDFGKFWWEVLPLGELDRTRKELREAEEQLAALLG